MGFFSDLFFGTGNGRTVAAVSGISAPLQPTSPWAGESNISQLVYRDLFGSSVDAVNRDVAMQVAPIKRGRSIIVGSIADLPLELGTFSGEDWTATAELPKWYTTTGTAQTPWHRMSLTLDDLIFHGWCLWAVQRDSFGQIEDAVRIAPDRWTFDEASPTGVSYNNQHVVDPKSVILFAGPDEGVLATGAEVIRAWRALARTRVAKARNPIPMTVLQEVEKNSVNQAEAEAYVEAWGDRRQQENGMVGFLPAKLKLDTHGDTKPEMFDTAFNALRLDVGNIMNLPSSLLDGSTATASLTYVTREGERSALVDYLEYFMAPIEARLSQADVSPAGQLVRFNRSNLSRIPNDAHGATSADEDDLTAPEAA